jgi:hypothetical protein
MSECPTAQLLRRPAGARILATAALVLLPVTAFAEGAPPPDVADEARALAAICRNDALLHCPGIRPGGGRILACLAAQPQTLSPACRAALPKAEALKARADAAGVTPK